MYKKRERKKPTLEDLGNRGRYKSYRKGLELRRKNFPLDSEAQWGFDETLPVV